MPEATEFTLSHKELLTLIVKSLGIHEGRWGLSINMGISPGHYGPEKDQLSPGIAVAFSSLAIKRAESPNNFPESLVVDASEVNPQERIAKAPRSRKHSKP